MSMKIARLKTYWTVDEADTVIAFLDHLRDLLWETYGDQIIEMHRSATPVTESDADQLEPAFDDPIDF